MKTKDLKEYFILSSKKTLPQQGWPRTLVGSTWKNNPGGHVGTKRKTECEAKSSSESLARARKVYIHRKGHRSIPLSQQRFLLQCSMSGSWGSLSGISHRFIPAPLSNHSKLEFPETRTGLCFSNTTFYPQFLLFPFV